MTRIPPRLLALPVILAAALALSSCGSSSDSGGHDGPGMSTMKTTTPTTPKATGTAATGAKNAADVAFATGMIPHHAQAVEMADLAPKQAADPQVKTLATKIKKAQGPEIARMSGWLAGWGAPVPGSAGGHDMSAMGGQMDGMMSSQEMTKLGQTSGAAFDRMWLEAMAKHHEGAVSMAKTELAEGTNPEAKKLAQVIIDGQSAELVEMKSILTKIPS